MRISIGIVVLACSLSGCGISKVIPNEYGRPELIAESGYSTGGCLAALKKKANELGVNVKNVRVENTFWDRTKTILLYPMIKGATCTADIE
jgi:hypothetical protein